MPRTTTLDHFMETLAAFTELMVKHQHRRTFGIDQFKLLDNLRRVLFLFHLFCNEPMEQHLGWHNLFL